MTGKFIVGLWLVLWYFGKAAWTGQIFPITAGGRIYDHGKRIGHLEGGKPQAIGRILAIPVLAVAEGLELLSVFRFFVLTVFLAKVLIWIGYLEDPDNTFPAWAVWLSVSSLGIASLICFGEIVIRRKVEGLRVILPRMFGFSKQQQPKPEQPQPQPPLVVVERTLLERIAAGFEDLAAGIGRFFKDKEEEDAGQD